MSISTSRSSIEPSICAMTHRSSWPRLPLRSRRHRQATGRSDLAKERRRRPPWIRRQAAQLGLEATAHAIGGNDARAMNLYLAPGESTDGRAAKAADGACGSAGSTRSSASSPGESRFAPALGECDASAKANSRRTARPDLGGQLLRALSNLLGVGPSPWSDQPRRIIGGFTPAGDRRHLELRRIAELGSLRLCRTWPAAVSGAPDQHQRLVVALVEPLGEVGHRRID